MTMYFVYFFCVIIRKHMCDFAVFHTYNYIKYKANETQNIFKI